MMWRVGKQLPLADEMLYTSNGASFASPLTYTAVGARSTEDTEHRHVASGLESVVGMKNPTSGNIVKGVDGVQVAQHPQHLLLNNKHVETSGNSFAHLVLRGGETSSNYGPESLAIATRELLEKKRHIQNPAVVVDASHDNSRNGHGKDPSLQAYVVRSVLDGIRHRREEYALVRGFMIETHILGGRQTGTPNPEIPQSITDPCISWEEYERIVLDTADALR
jgi:3-deoxy-7-phosphoheptulonate synthase